MAKMIVQSLEKSYAGEELFSGLSFELAPGMRLAVAGPNGCGKSTLLRIMAGVLEPDAGQVSASKGARLGYVAQELGPEDLVRPLLSWVLSAVPSWSALWEKWERAAASGDEARMARLSERQAEIERQFGYNPRHKARAILSGLGFAEADLAKTVGELSGGWRERAKLGRVLLAGADLLLLDEPTNHLDLEAVEWLENYLLSFKGAMAFVVHERVFLDRVSSHVLVLGRRKAQVRKGSFESYLAWEQENSLRLEREAQNLRDRIVHERDYIRRFRVKARKASQAQSKLKRVERMEDELRGLERVLSGLRPFRRLNFRLPEPARGDKAAVSAVDLEFRYPGGDPLWPRLDFQVFRGRKIALAAPNGAGKSTLLKLVAGVLAPTSGRVRVGPNTRPAYFSQHRTEVLDTGRTVLAELRRLSDPNMTEEQLMGALGLFLLGEPYFDRPVGVLSGGEKSRLLLAALFTAGANLLVLDEPTNHLDLESRDGLVKALKDFPGTILLVAHDRHLLREVAHEVWALGPEGLTVYSGGFAEYQAARRPGEAGDESGSRNGSGRRLDRDQRRRQAEIRNSASRELRPLKGEYAGLERELEGALEAQAGLEARMNDPEAYSDPAGALSLGEEYRRVAARAEEIVERMHHLERDMEDINRRCRGLLEA
ncbi:MAG: ABC-F family ATP-binding cassette domain-containing protein [Desulfovibrionaceae bacterium]|nr:ABC-F family ATP-binding cassette domain-containing protein [Desulfovibrionaceae bacterium]